MRIGIYDRHVAEPHLSDPDLRDEAGFAGNGPAGDADQFAEGTGGLFPYQHAAQRGIADRIFRAGVDDRGHLDPVDRRVGYDKLAKLAACGNGDRFAILERLTLQPGQCDLMTPEIEDDIATLQHVGAEEACRSERGRGQYGGIDLMLLGGAGLHIVEPDRLNLIGADQTLDRDRAIGRQAQLPGETIRYHAAVGASVDRERKRTLTIDLGHNGHPACRIGRGGQGFADEAAACHSGHHGDFRRGEIAADQRRQQNGDDTERHGIAPRPSIRGGLGGMMPYRACLSKGAAAQGALTAGSVTNCPRRRRV